MKNPLHYMFCFCFLLNSMLFSDETVSAARENIRKALQIETDLVLKDETWQKEKLRLSQEIDLLKLKTENLKKEILALEASIKKTKEEAQVDLDIQKDLNEKHQAVLKDLKESVSSLRVEPSILPDDENLKQILKSIQSQVVGDNLNPSALFDQLNELHNQWWQMGQSFQIKTGSILIDEKEYHGEIIRLGLVYRFLLFENHERWAYYDLTENKWKFGRPEEIAKLIKIKNILQKKEPSQLVELPGK